MDQPVVMNTIYMGQSQDHSVYTSEIIIKITAGEHIEYHTYKNNTI